MLKHVETYWQIRNMLKHIGKFETCWHIWRNMVKLEEFLTLSDKEQKQQQRT